MNCGADLFLVAKTVLFINVYTLERTIVRAEATKKGTPADADVEKGPSGEGLESRGRSEEEDVIRPSYEKDRANADDATVRPGTTESSLTKDSA